MRHFHFLEKKGLKIQSVVKNGIREQLEDEIDLTSYKARKDEEDQTIKLRLLKSFIARKFINRPKSVRTGHLTADTALETLQTAELL